MTDPTFRNINRLFAYSFKDGDSDPAKDFFDDYHIQLVEIKDFNALIGNKPFFISP